MRIVLPLFIVMSALLLPYSSRGQDSLPSAYLKKIYQQTRHQTQGFHKHISRDLRRLRRQQSRLLDKIKNWDSVQYAVLYQHIDSIPVSLAGIHIANHYPLQGAGISYLPRLDSLQTMLRFLQQLPAGNEQAQKALQQLGQWQIQLQQAEQIKQRLGATLSRIKALSNLPRLQSLQRQISRYQQQVQRYAGSIQQYKELLHNPAAIERRALQLLNKLPAFRDFMQQHGQLAGLFSLPLTPSGGGGMAGLQTRASVQQLLQQNIGAGGAGALQQVRDNVQGAQTELQKLKDRAKQLGGSSEEATLFADAAGMKKPANNQRSKTFLQRLELGGNIQFARPNGFVPTTGDIAATVAYKLNDKSSIGIGGGYKLGLGSIRRIRFTHEGVSLRSFADMKLKGQLFITAGYELNHFAQFRRMEGIGNLDWWQSSGLAGLTKKYKISKKRGGNFQVLYDFLYNQHTPRSQPLLIRTGFSF